jgi:competence protein ComEA
MSRSSSTERAGLVLVCALFALALPWPGTGPEPCPRPVLRAGAEVVCAPAGALHPRLPGPARRLFDLPLDPNRADVVALETLPGIGPALARAIIEERCRRPFTELRDLRRVHGLGPTRVAALSPFLAVEGALAACDMTSVESGRCRSSCGSTEAGPDPGRERFTPVEKRR